MTVTVEPYDHDYGLYKVTHRKASASKKCKTKRNVKGNKCQKERKKNPLYYWLRPVGCR